MQAFPEASFVRAIGPGRLDVGTFFDQPSIAAIYNWVPLRTCTIAIDQFTTVELKPFRKDRIRVTLADIQETFTHPLPLTGKFGLINACLTHFAVTGVDVKCAFTAPPCSGLGGSSVLMTLLCASLALGLQGRNKYKSIRRILETAAFIGQQIEDGMFSPTGLQDHLASVYGGVQMFSWTPLSRVKYTRCELLSRKWQLELEARLVLGYVGSGRKSAVLTSQMFQSFQKPGKTRESWLGMNDDVLAFGKACETHIWKEAVAALRRIDANRHKLVPGAYGKAFRELRDSALSCSSAFSPAGAGGGGFCFALAPTQNRAECLADKWSGILKAIPRAFMERPRVEESGIEVVMQSAPFHEQTPE